MNTYEFRTVATMKEYNRKKWWIDSNIVRDIEIHADTVKDALKQWQAVVSEKYFITVSDTAIKNKSPMYIDTPDGAKQVGFVITGKTEFEDRDAYKWSTQYIDLWVSVVTLVDTVF